MDRTKKWRSYPIVVLDVETTGLDADKGDRVVEVAAVRFEPAGDVDNGNELGLTGYQMTGFCAALVNPGRPIGEASAIHGITDEMVKTALPFADVWPAVLALFDEETVAAAYNAPFDRAFLRAEHDRLPTGFRDGAALPYGLRTPWLDPLVWVREADRYEKGRGRHKLAPTCERWGVTLEDGHKAEDDAIAAGRLLTGQRMREAMRKVCATESDPSLISVQGTQLRLASNQEARFQSFQREQAGSLGKGSQCRSCGAAITWIELATGKRMPLDVMPNATLGNVLVDETGAGGRILTGEELETMRSARKSLHLSHFATCPNATQHRAPRRP